MQARWLCSLHDVTVLAAFVLQDTPGIYEEGPVADSVANFIKEGNEEYMAFEQVGRFYGHLAKCYCSVLSAPCYPPDYKGILTLWRAYILPWGQRHTWH